MSLAFKNYGPHDPKKREQFQKFYELLIERNSQFNLTTITSMEDVEEKHFYDSLAPLIETNYFEKMAWKVKGSGLSPEQYSKEAPTVIDIGAGAGFPSIPIKIMNPAFKMTVLDSVNKKVNFLDEAGKELGFTDYIAVHARAEDFAKTHREKYDILLARAVAPLPTLLELAAPLVKVKGCLVLWKGSSYREEVLKSANAFKELGLSISFVKDYSVGDLLGGARQDRFILFITKDKPTPAKYPRGQNKPRTNPL